MRSFVAISLPTNDLIRNLLAECQSMGKVVEGKNLHLTLKFLGEIDNPGEIGRSLAEISIKKFSILLRGMGAFPSPQKGRILYVKAYPEDLVGKLASEVDTRTKRIPLDHPFNPHITLIRAKDRRDFSGLIAKYEHTEFLSQEVNSFFLYESILRPSGPIYNVIQEFQLI